MQTLIFWSATRALIDFDHPALSDPDRTSAAGPVCAQLGSGTAECDIESLIATE